MKRLLLLLFIFFVVFALSAQTPNWSQDIAPIFYVHCTNCHNPKGIAPKSFLNYADAHDNREAIKNEVAAHRMPPWLPDPNYRHFCNERILSPKQIQAIVYWVNAEAPSGDTTKAPPKPEYKEGAEITAPDWTGRIPSYTVRDSGDDYRCFVIPSGLLTQKYITELEIIPGDRSMVHHVIVFEDTSAIPSQLDAEDPAPGYIGFGGTGSPTSSLIGTWVPGSSVFKWPAGTGILLHAHTNIIVEIHYPAGSKDKTDSTRINMKLSDGPLRIVSVKIVPESGVPDNGQLFIPANTIKTFTASYTFSDTVSILGFAAHMHLIGHSISSWAVTPNADTIHFIDIPDWDFHWQGFFEFQKLQKITPHTVLYCSATYDNTSYNLDNPNHPPKDVSYGQKTTDEMMYVSFAYTPYQSGDENIIQDSTILNSACKTSAEKVNSLCDPYLDSLGDQGTIEFYLSQSEIISLSLYDENGKLISAIIKSENTYPKGFHNVQFKTGELNAGIYFLQMKTKEEIFVRRLVKT